MNAQNQACHARNAVQPGTAVLCSQPTLVTCARKGRFVPGILLTYVVLLLTR